MFQRWLDTGTASWSKLIVALKSPVVNKCGIADKIAIDDPSKYVGQYLDCLVKLCVISQYNIYTAG